MSFLCFTCGLRFSSENGVASHCSSKCHTRAFECDKCKGFMWDNEKAVELHIATVHKQNKQKAARKVVCDFCPKTFVTVEDLRQHQDSVHPISCQICKKVFKNTEDYDWHQLTVYTFPCVICDVTLPSRRQLKFHQSSTSHLANTAISFESGICNLDCELVQDLQDRSNNSLTYKCKSVDLFLNSPFNLDKNPDSVRIKEPETSNTSYFESERPIPYPSASRTQCPLCKETFSIAADLLTHLTSKHFVSCRKCTALFNDALDLAKHHTNYHHPLPKTSNPTPRSSIQSKPESKPLSTITNNAGPKKSFRTIGVQTNRFVCEECDEVCETASELAFHLDQSPFHSELVLACYECKLQFNTQLALLAHLDSRPHKARWVLCLV